MVILILEGRSFSLRGEPSLYQVTSGSGLPVHAQEAVVPSPSSGFFLVKVRSPTISGFTGERERGKKNYCMVGYTLTAVFQPEGVTSILILSTLTIMNSTRVCAFIFWSHVCDCQGVTSLRKPGKWRFDEFHYTSSCTFTCHL